ncbi:MAG: DNA ligase [Clostridia bacterium]|nr:DNA ligase [Clostridia bacterium]
MTAWPVPPEAMEPVAWPRPFDDPAFAVQPKWDGIRMLAFTDGAGRIELRTRRGGPREAQYPELRALAAGPPAVLDGEVVVVAGGRAAFPAVLRRDRARHPREVARLAALLPAVYLAFDLLWLARDLRREPWRARQEALAESFGPLAGQSGGTFALVATFPGERATELYRAAAALGHEGIVAKRRLSPYRPGRSDDWRKVKVWRTLSAVVGGFRPGPCGPASLLLGSFLGAELRFIGRAALAAAPAEAEELGRVLSAHTRREAPFSPPEPPPGAGWRFTEPVAVVRVRYREWTPDLRLRHPLAVAWLRRARPADVQLVPGALAPEAGEG